MEVSFPILLYPPKRAGFIIVNKTPTNPKWEDCQRIDITESEARSLEMAGVPVWEDPPEVNA